MAKSINKRKSRLKKGVTGNTAGLNVNYFIITGGDKNEQKIRP